MKDLTPADLLKLTAMLFPVLIWGCSTGPANQHEETVFNVKTEKVTESNALNVYKYVGVVEEKSSVALSFPVIGAIEKVYVSEGQYVKKGQLLATLNSTSAKNICDAAESTLKQAQDGYDRFKSIHDNGSLPEVQFIDIKTKLQQAQSSYNIAKKNLEDCSLYAPEAGVIGKKFAEAGEYAVIGKPVLTLLDISSVKVKFSVPESEIAVIPANCESTITVAALGDKEFSGKGIEKCVEASVVSHAYPARITLSNPGNKLLPGMVCRVELSNNNTTKNIVVPVNAVRISTDGNKFVWCDVDGTARRKYVETGEVSGNGVAVISGLTAGDLIVTEGFQKVSEGDKIVEK